MLVSIIGELRIGILPHPVMTPTADGLSGAAARCRLEQPVCSR